MPKTFAIIAPLHTKTDATRGDGATGGGDSIEGLRTSQDKARAMDVMTRGAAVVAAQLYAAGRIDGIVGIGGSAGTAIATSAMRALPVGVPKLVVSTVA